ncbi:IpaD/SipD/SspD family type III secretion system needle tip protein, partial [Proteus mirabilis]
MSISRDVLVFTEEINDLPHLNTRVNTDNYFENRLEDEVFLSWESNREYQDMNYDNNKKNKFIKGLINKDKYYYLDDDYHKVINEKNNFLNQFS